jgi:hypothetical protein
VLMTGGMLLLGRRRVRKPSPAPARG